MTFTAAAMFGGAAFVGLVEGLIPGGPELSLIPALAAVGFVTLLLLVGPRLPMGALGALGPIGAALIAFALATTPPGQGDGALLYIWPVLWVAYFFGRTGSVLMVAWIGVVQGAALIYSGGVLDRWIDLMVSVGVVAAVVHTLSERNKRLVARLEAEARVDKLTGVLEFLGGVLRSQARSPDIVARLGGEEFVVLLTRADADEAEAYAERVRAA